VQGYIVYTGRWNNDGKGNKMTEKDPKDIFADMNVSKILVSILETIDSVSVPTSVFAGASNEDKELQVDYDADAQTFIFKLKDKDAESDQQ